MISQERQTATMARCQTDGCDKGVFARGRCSSHYYALLDEEKWGVEVCSWPRCGRSARAAGFCTSHYGKVRYDRRLEQMLEPHYRAERCAVDSCEEPAYSAGVCRNHYHKLRSRGTTEPAHQMVPVNPQRLNAALVCRGLLKAELGTKLDVSRQRIGQLITAKRFPKHHAETLVETLGVSLEWLANPAAPQLVRDDLEI